MRRAAVRQAAGAPAAAAALLFDGACCGKLGMRGMNAAELEAPRFTVIIISTLGLLVSSKLVQSDWWLHGLHLGRQSH